MRVSVLSEVERRPRRVAVGAFDGVHIGHRDVIRGCDTVLTFEPHPLAVTRPEAMPQLLTDRVRKLRRLAELGVAETVIIPFDRSVAAQSASAFLEEVLLGRLGAEHVSIGANFRFGAAAAGDAALLRSEARFTTRIAPLLSVGGEPVSSTRIRKMIRDGAVGQASALLGSTVTYPARLGRSEPGPEPAVRMAQVDFASALCVPGPNRYACLVDGLPAVLRVALDGCRLLIDATLDRALKDELSGGCEVEIEFLEAVLAPASQALPSRLD